MLYASRTGTKVNLDALRAHRWGLLVSRAGKWRREGFDQWACDNGAWADYQAHRPFDTASFEEFLGWVEHEPVPPAWIVLPDIVGGGLASLRLSLRYVDRCRALAPMVLIAAQDGMVPDDVVPFLAPTIGVFLGGTTPWKEGHMAAWGRMCLKHELYYHVGRVNTARRIRLAVAAGADSIDGTSASRFAVTIPWLSNVSRQASFEHFGL